MRLHTQIFVGMAVGAAIGLPLSFAAEAGLIDRAVALQVGAVGEWFGRLFLALLNMVVVPLIATSIVSSITTVGVDGQMARLGSRTFTYYFLTSALAILTGIALVNLIRPGDGLDYAAMMEAARGEIATRSMKAPDVAAAAAGGVSAIVSDLLLRTVPNNVVSAASSNTTILSVIFFAGAFGVAAVKTGGEALQQVDALSRAIYDIMVKMTSGILRFAPLGIAGYMLFVTATTGLSMASGLAWYMLTVALGLVIHGAISLPLILWWFTGRSPWAFALTMKDALLTAFSTASSAATLPVTMRCATEGAGVPPRVANFTLTLGSTVNMDGTALYEAVAVLFVAQMLGDLSIGQQAIVAFTALMASIGAAGIPHAGTVMMVVVLQSVGLPTDAVLVILAVDRVLDMGRTTINVWSDMVGAAIIARYEPG
jgi:proton glutamate symport protein